MTHGIKTWAGAQFGFIYKEALDCSSGVVDSHLICFFGKDLICLFLWSN